MRESINLNILITVLSIGRLVARVETARYEHYKSDLPPSPYFISTPRVYKEQIGGSVTFSCRVENLGSSTLIWKKDARMISAGNMIIRKDPRMNLDGQSLSISSITDEDSGEYICEVETFGAPLHQQHKLEVLVPPRVESTPSDGRLVVRKGTTITLECRGTGNPTPNITWTRENNMLPSGEKSMAGVSINIPDVSRHHTGLYICTAENGVGHPSAAEIDLQVLYPPEIEMDSTWIKTKDGIEAEVSCIVHGEPIPEVKWFKETMILEPTNNRHMESYGNRRVLVLRNVNEFDFGNYSCQADNSLGRLSKSIEVSGRPHVAKVLSAPLSYSKDQYNLTWSVDSFLKIEEYRILYRVILKNEGPGPGFNGPPKHTEWTNIIPTLGSRQLIGVKSSFTFTGSFAFFGLDPDTHYEVIIQSRNREGWSDPSQIFKFSTRAQDYDPRGLELHKSKQQGFLSAAPSVNSLTSLMLYIILAAAVVYSF
ncbi:limbic system-associated membrane protein [Eurytemora carolleeae]|uniref:limbic system-associated membrane protein n=1 Tax=Eurytemora carolleeae TaxID=1294199 RepID=UPI000C75E9F9|nr:limbic system-associated membrane protein [Eurytemora carolleeae]|eukprot:XP_023342737.1 limbic system-associated membrane protein-like [Eurytemora affinis]